MSSFFHQPNFAIAKFFPFPNKGSIISSKWVNPYLSLGKPVGVVFGSFRQCSSKRAYFFVSPGRGQGLPPWLPTPRLVYVGFTLRSHKREMVLGKRITRENWSDQQLACNCETVLAASLHKDAPLFFTQDGRDSGSRFLKPQLFTDPSLPKLHWSAANPPGFYGLLRSQVHLSLICLVCLLCCYLLAPEQTTLWFGISFPLKQTSRWSAYPFQLKWLHVSRLLWLLRCPNKTRTGCSEHTSPTKGLPLTLEAVQAQRSDG